MGIRNRVFETLNIKQESSSSTSAKQQLSKYVLSQFFIQLVNFQQLMRAMNEFVGENKTIKSATLFKGLEICLNKMLRDVINDRYDMDSQTVAISKCFEELDIPTWEIKIKSLYPRLIKFTAFIDIPNETVLNGDLKNKLEQLFNESLKLQVVKARGKSFKVEISSSRQYTLEHGVAFIGKGGTELSGDSYLCENFQNGATLLGISDGMGNGKEAQKESSQALRVLKCMLNFDVSLSEAIGVLAELKRQSNVDERYFSLDLCYINKETGQAEFYKQAATTSFILRDGNVSKIEMSGLPIGAASGDQIKHRKIDLQIGDIIIMCSDGVIDTFGESDLLEKRIKKNLGLHIEEMTQDLLNYTLRRNRGNVFDDMMIVCAIYKPAR